MAHVHPLRRQHGILASAARFPWLSQWREPCLFALSLPWPLFLLALGLLYLAINLAFALLYRLDPVGLAGSSSGGPASLAEAFFFSVQTLGSLDYSPLRPVDGWAHLEVTAESLTGLLFVALTASLAFALLPQPSPPSLFAAGRGAHLQRGAHLGISGGQCVAHRPAGGQASGFSGAG